MAATPERTTVHVALPRTGIRSVSVHLILTAATTLMLMFAFQPWGLSWLAYIALVPAGLLAVRASAAKRLAWTSFTVFWAGWLVMIAWVIPVSEFALAALSALMAAYWSLALVIIYLLHRRYRCAMVVLLPLVWVSCEWMRGRFFAGGFSWFMLGQSQGSLVIDAPPGRIVQTADLFGELGVSFIIVMTSGLLIDLVTRPIMQPIGQDKHRIHPTIRGAGILWLLVTVGAWFYGDYRIGQWSDVTHPGPYVAVIQTNVSQNNKINRTPEQDLQDWQSMVDLSRQAALHDPTPDLIVWPETMVPGALNPEAISFFTQANSYYSGSEVYHELIRMLAVESATNLLVGSHAYEAFRDVTLPGGGVGPYPARQFNSVFLYYADGEQVPLRYDKMHRVPFGEYTPWVSAIPAVKKLFIKWFTPYDYDYSLTQGESLTVFDVPVLPTANDTTQGKSPWVLRVVTPICYEDAVARAVRRLVYSPSGVKRADMVVNQTNSAWYPGQRQQPQHLQIATLRCIENRVPMARSVNGGISGFIDSLGRVRAVVEVGGQRQWVQGLAVYQPRLDDRQTLYGRVGELPIGCMTLLTVLLLVWSKISPRKTAD